MNKKFRVVIEIETDDFSRADDLVEMFEDFSDDWADFDVHLTDIAATEVK